MPIKRLRARVRRRRARRDHDGPVAVRCDRRRVPVRSQVVRVCTSARLGRHAVVRMSKQRLPVARIDHVRRRHRRARRVPAAHHQRVVHVRSDAVVRCPIHAVSSGRCDNVRHRRRVVREQRARVRSTKIKPVPNTRQRLRHNVVLLHGVEIRPVAHEEQEKRRRTAARNQPHVHRRALHVARKGVDVTTVQARAPGRRPSHRHSHRRAARSRRGRREVA